MFSRNRLSTATARYAFGLVAAGTHGANGMLATDARVATSITLQLKLLTNAYRPSNESRMSPTDPVKTRAASAPVLRFTKITLFEIDVIAYALSRVIRITRSDRMSAVAR